ncbi:MAG: C4-dicarboxylate ABC transporter permease [Gammaproteobacteria bacterium]|nr:TRAP transporter small permease subunit [Gammaproteobacteria bacterium]PCH63090.1 MAG: C4-dicarboxylate ABC transporter permease [Gammaproteobacteria bacterium]PCH64276.1 MAG: C4-dicarboxylate ABC transporter permease [Gammaproteobacteria bacterium]
MSSSDSIIKRLYLAIDQFSEFCGRAVSWLVLAMTLLIAYDVIMRYFFQNGSVALQELEWHLFAVIFLFGSAYTLKHQDHVCVDIFAQRHWMTRKVHAWIYLLCTLFFLLPFCIVIIVSSWDYVANSYNILPAGERSPDPGGLPYRYLLKAAIPTAFFLLFIQGLSLALRSYAVLRGDMSALPDPKHGEGV